MLSRREFLKLSSYWLGACAAGSLVSALEPVQTALAAPLDKPWTPGDPTPPQIAFRVATQFVYVYSDPDFKSERVGLLKRDMVLRAEEEVVAPNGPRRNPRWYRLKEGYAHSAHLQRVEGAHLNQPVDSLPPSGQLGEITVPYIQTHRKTRTRGWVPLYRLYYGSVYWITSLEEGPDGGLWYGLTDDLLHVQYCIPATHMRPIPAEELAPISPEVEARAKKIEVSIRAQTLMAYEDKEVVLQTDVSTGIPGNEPTPEDIPTATPEGHFHIEVKVPSRHMGDGNLTDDVEAYELPGVPWVSFFHITGVALHGTYWHDNFGRMMSHGCVNMRSEDALWIYRWSLPATSPENWNTKGHGTLVHVFSE